MPSIEMLKPWRIIASLVPVMYAGLLIAELQNSWMWILTAAVVLFILLCLVSTLGYSPLFLIPTFAGTFLLLAGVFALFFGAPIHSLTTSPRWPVEVWVAIPFALVYIGWGVMLARRYMYSA